MAAASAAATMASTTLPPEARTSWPTLSAVGSPRIAPSALPVSSAAIAPTAAKPAVAPANCRLNSRREIAFFVRRTIESVSSAKPGIVGLDSTRRPTNCDIFAPVFVAKLFPLRSLCRVPSCSLVDRPFAAVPRSDVRRRSDRDGCSQGRGDEVHLREQQDFSRHGARLLGLFP